MELEHATPSPFERLGMRQVTVTLLIPAATLLISIMINSLDWTKSERIAHKMSMDECIATIMTRVT